MWKLFATVLALSDTGSVSMSTMATDFASYQACQAAAHELFGPAEREIQGHRIVIRAIAECRSDGSPPPPPAPQFRQPPFFAPFFGR